MNVYKKSFLTLFTLLCICVVSITWITAYNYKIEANANQRKREITSITADFRITKADGIKPLSLLMSVENPQVIPFNKTVKSFYYAVSDDSAPLILSSISPVREGFHITIANGNSLLLPLSPESLPQLNAFDFIQATLVSTQGICDFFVHIELVDK